VGRPTRQVIYCSTTRIYSLPSHMPAGGVEPQINLETCVIHNENL
jgi:hypothetical protein